MTTESKVLPTFVFVLGTRFPTEKAYGVTTEQSALAIQSKGLAAKIITPWYDENFHSDLEIEEKGALVRKLFAKLIYASSFPIFFNVFLVYFALRIKFSKRAEERCFWTRDILLAFIMSFASDRKVICEVHRTPKHIRMSILRLLCRNKNVIIGPIGDFLDTLGFINKEKYVKLPMSVNANEVCTTEEILNRKKVVTYLGNASSSEFTLSYDVLNATARWLEQNHDDWTLEVIGISHDNFVSSLGEIPSKNLVAMGRMERAKALERLRESSLGLVIYPDSPYFRDSSPIKIVEYAASGLAIIASDTLAHRRLLNEDNCKFFSYGSLTSLFAVLDTVIEDIELRRKIALTARNWASRLTYQNRIEPIIQIITTSR